jgi:serine protease Do
MCAKRCHLVVTAAVVAALTVLAPAAAKSVFQDAENGVVRIVVVDDNDDSHAWTGSGFKVGPGLYVTNRHVIEPALNGGSHRVYIIPSQQGEQPREARIRAASTVDLALIAAPDVAGSAFALDPSLPDSGQQVAALGYPGQMDEVLGHDTIGKPSPPDVTLGGIINSGEVKNESGDDLTRIVHSATVWPGNSGGPLIDKCGRLIAVNTALHVADGLAQQNIAISARDVERFLRDNQIDPVIDQRPCKADGTIEGGPPVSAAPPAAPPANTPEPAAEAPADASTFGVILFVLVLAGVVGFGAIIVRRHQREQKAADEHGGEEDF